MTPDPPDAAALIQRAQKRLAKESTCRCEGEYHDSCGDRYLIEKLLALLTARETALQPVGSPTTNVPMPDFHQEYRESNEAALAAKVTALEAALATAQSELETERLSNDVYAKRCDVLRDQVAQQHQQLFHVEAALATAQQELNELKQGICPSGSVTNIKGLIALSQAHRDDSEFVDELEEETGDIRDGAKTWAALKAERDALRDQVAQLQLLVYSPDDPKP